MVPHTPPSLNRLAFHCPHCQAYAKQTWYEVMGHNASLVKVQGWKTAKCEHCHKFSLWNGEMLIYPNTSSVPSPNPDLAPEIQADYNEASSILIISPRGAAALLRLSIQKLCIQLGLPGKDLNAEIGLLTKRGLPPEVQQALDIVRVVGNNAVHPGQIDFSDDVDSARKLFGLINIIADVMITRPKQIAAMYQTIVPEPQRKAIERRDA